MIDYSSAFRMEIDVHLVVPEVNAADAKDRPRGIIANPNCTTIQMVVALKAIENLSHIQRVHVSTYQAASGAGAAAMDELYTQYKQVLANERPISVEEAREAFAQGEGLVLEDNPAEKKYPMPLFLSGKDPVYVGRIRKDLANENGLTFWIVGDQIKKGAALNAVQIAEYLVRENAL